MYQVVKTALNRFTGKIETEVYDLFEDYNTAIKTAKFLNGARGCAWGVIETK